MLRYLRRIDDITNGGLRWGILTNGAKWRLYYSGARSVSEQFFEADLAAILNIPGSNEDSVALAEDELLHWLRVFVLIFRNHAFTPLGPEQLTFHQRALAEGKFYEQRVAENLSQKVFAEVFPLLVESLAQQDAEANLQEVKQGALILLYRLLFIFYAEDRDLLPVKDQRYDDYGLRTRVRLDVGRRMDSQDTFSTVARRYWNTLTDLFAAIDQGDSSIGLPPYNGGLFQQDKTPILVRAGIPDSILAKVIDCLSFEQAQGGRKYINYRNLSVQQLGSIYERLLEYDVIRENGQIIVRPNIFARKTSGSYYTPDELVQLILVETLQPLVQARKNAFLSKVEELRESTWPDNRKIGQLKTLDPAEELLNLKICDPAMGSGHFLVSLVDFMADQVITAMAEAEMDVPEEWGDYISPLGERIDKIRNIILANAESRQWTIDDEQLDDRHIIRRMVLKRCIYGVDKNPMAVELAKVSLWLHTFTVGAPLSFLDHHLRAGNSLFGSWVKAGVEKAIAYGTPLLLQDAIQEAFESASKMQLIESLTDAEIAEAHHSATIFNQIQRETAPLNGLLSLIHAIDWLNLRERASRDAVRIFFGKQLGDPLQIAMGKANPNASSPAGQKFSEILDKCRELVEEENFLHWQVAFPGIWKAWEEEGLYGGFHAVIGNPPWDRMKLQQVEWFAERRRDIAMQTRAADRERLIQQLESTGDPLARDYAKASERAEAAKRMARTLGEYPLLSGGDTNLYSLFVERAMKLVRPDGLVGLLVPSGIASDKTSSAFFKSVATEGRLKALYDFENRRTRYSLPSFFPDVDDRFKFCAFVASPSALREPAQCAFFVQAVSELKDPDIRFSLTAKDFARVNPNTGTAPVFRTRRDAELTARMYEHGTVLVDRSGTEEVRAWPVRYCTMFHMTNDSALFRTRAELEEKEGAYPIGGNRFESASGVWVPLYEGKMVQAFDHRAASVVVNVDNQHRPAQPLPATLEQHQDHNWLPCPQYWVNTDEVEIPSCFGLLAFKDVTSPTNVRSMIAALIPFGGVGNTLPVLLGCHNGHLEAEDASLLVGNFNSILFDFIARQKVQGQHLNWYIVEQLPIITKENLIQIYYGTKRAADIIHSAVLELTYTARDMAPFARDMGYVDEAGEVRPPFTWDEERRLHLRAKLDAIFFLLYGVTDRDDVRYIYSTFPILERAERAAHGGVYRSCELCLAYMNALRAGKPDAQIQL